MGTVREILEENRGAILDLWTQTARKAASANGLTSLELASMMPEYLSLLGRADVTLPAQLTAEQQKLIEHHLSNRLRQGFALYEILTEFAVLGRCISQFFGEDAHRPSTTDAARLFAELYLTSSAVAKIFNEHLLEDEQVARRYARLLRDLDARVHGRDPGSSSTRLEETMALIMDAMGAQTAALLLWDPRTDRLIATAAVGEAREPSSPSTHLADGSTFLGSIVAAAGRPTLIPDLRATRLDVGDALRRSPIRSLLGIRLAAHDTLAGVLYVGLAEARPFTPSEIRRLEGFGESLIVHLDNAAKDSKLHALEGMLASVKARARRLVAEDPESARVICDEIVGEIERMEDLIHAPGPAQPVEPTSDAVEASSEAGA